MFVSCGFVHYLVCHNGPLDTLIMSGVSCIYSTGTNSMVMLPNVWLHVAVVVGTAVAQWLRCCATNRKVAG